VTTGLFALLHGNLYGLPAYLLVGAVAGFATVTLDTVYAGITYHTIYNAACLVIPWLLAQSGGDAAEAGPLPILPLLLEEATILALMATLLASLRLRARDRGFVPIPRIRRPLEGRDRAMLLVAVGCMLITLLVVQLLAVRAAAEIGGAL